MKLGNKSIVQIVVFCLIFTSATLSAIATPSTNSQVSPINLDEKLEQFVGWLDTNTDGTLTDLGNMQIAQVTQWIDSQLETKNQIENLEQQIKADELLLTEKKRMLNDVQQKINLLKLTPNQFEAIANYNKSLSHDLTFTEWVSEHTMWFDSIKDCLIAALFFILGMYWDSVREKRRKNKRAKRL